MGAGWSDEAGDRLSIRRAGRGDLDSLLVLLSQLHPDGEPLARTEELEAAYDQMLSAPGRTVLLAEAGSRTIGTLDLAILPRLTRRGAPAAVVEDVIVDVGHRRRGVARALLAAAEETARAAGASKLQLLSTGARGAAHALYEQAGYTAPVRGFRRDLDAGAR